MYEKNRENSTMTTTFDEAAYGIFGWGAQKFDVKYADESSLCYRTEIIIWNTNKTKREYKHIWYFYHISMHNKFINNRWPFASTKTQYRMFA